MVSNGFYLIYIIFLWEMYIYNFQSTNFFVYLLFIFLHLHRFNLLHQLFSYSSSVYCQHYIHICESSTHILFYIFFILISFSFFSVIFYLWCHLSILMFQNFILQKWKIRAYMSANEVTISTFHSIIQFFFAIYNSVFNGVSLDR